MQLTPKVYAWTLIPGVAVAHVGGVSRHSNDNDWHENATPPHCPKVGIQSIVGGKPFNIACSCPTFLHAIVKLRNIDITLFSKTWKLADSTERLYNLMKGTRKVDHNLLH